MGKSLRLSLMTIVFVAVMGCGSPKVVSPPKLVEQPNPIEAGAQLSGSIFSDLYKKGIARSAKDIMDRACAEMASGRLPVGARIAPMFYAKNAGGDFTGIRIVIDGSALDQGMLANPKLFVNSLNAGGRAKPKEFVGSPSIQTIYGTTKWTAILPDYAVDNGDQLHVVVNCDMAKPGFAQLVFSVYSVRDAANALIRHSVALNISPAS